MRIAQLLVDGRAVLAVRHGDAYLDLGALGVPADLGAFIAAPPDPEGLLRVLESAPPAARIDAARARHLPPIAAGARILCLGLNYTEHAAEASFARPEAPVIFGRFPQSFAGHEQPIERPSVSTRFDFEAELVAVIGRRGRHVPADKALEHVFGYTLMNDGSVRDFQTRTPQWTLGKNFDRSGGLGPEIVSADELPPGAQGLTLTGRLNGNVMQQASTSQMIFDVVTTIAYVTQGIELLPGDLIAMGTPSGVGNARNPQVFMVPGDVFEVEVERVGLLRNPVKQEARE